MYKFGQRSKNRLKGVHPDLVRVLDEAITASPHDFAITEGVRTLERQKELYAARKSTTMRSRHLTGHAVDIVVYDEAGKVTWDIDYYRRVTDHIKVVAKLCDVELEFGIDWKSFVDGPHIQLPWGTHPK